MISWTVKILVDQMCVNEIRKMYFRIFAFFGFFGLFIT